MKDFTLPTAPRYTHVQGWEEMDETYSDLGSQDQLIHAYLSRIQHHRYLYGFAIAPTFHMPLDLQPKASIEEA